MTSHRLLLIICALALFAITFLTYYPALYYDFVYHDDYRYIIADTSVHNLSLSNLLQLLTNVDAAYWGPSTRLSYAIEYYFWGSNPTGYHLSNQLLHALNVVGLFGLLYFILRLPHIHQSHYRSRFIAFTTSLLFALHPQNVEAVAWIAGRKDVLSLFLLLPTVFFYLLYTQKNHQYRWYFASLTCFIFAIGAKPTMMMVPFLLFLFDIYPLYRLPILAVSISNVTVISLKRALLEKIPFLLFALIPALFAMYAHDQINNLASLSELSLTHRTLNSAQMLLLYISHSFIPLGLAVLYPLPPLESLNIYPVFGLILITLLLIIRCQKMPFLLMAWLVFLLFLFPTLGLVSFNQVHAGSDRFTYIASISLYLIVSLALLQLSNYFKIKAIGPIMTGLLLITCLLLTRQQMPIWQTDISLWQHMVYTNPQHYIAHQGLARAYYRNEQPLKSLTHFKQSTVFNPECLDCHNSLARLYLQLGQLTPALKHFQLLVQKTDRCLMQIETVFYNMALIHQTQGNFKQALLLTTQALACQPEYKPAQQLQQQLQQQISNSQFKPIR